MGERISDLWGTEDAPSGEGVVLVIGVADFLHGDNADDALDMMQSTMHATVARNHGPMRCWFTTFSGDRALFETFLISCDLDRREIDEYLSAWDLSSRPLAVAHWGRPEIPGIRKARQN